MKTIILSILMLLGIYSPNLSSCFANEVHQNLKLTQNKSIKPNKEWTQFLELNGVQIEYKFAVCETKTVYNQVRVLFRFTNLTADKLSLSWATEIWRNNSCYNCARIDSEEQKKNLILKPNQVVAGTGTSADSHSLYLFANFIKLSPGMTDSKLTYFEFINFQSKVIL